MSKSQPAELHVVLGAGQVGPLLAEKLAAAGHEVRMVSRSRRREVPGVTWVAGDLSDVAVAREVTRGATAVYHCANPMRFDQWETLLPPLTRAVCAAVSGTAAHLVVLDNLYMYGVPAGGVIGDETPERPESRKGELRARLSAELFAAQARGDLRLSVGRGPDFFGANGTRTMTFHPLFFRQLARGRLVPVMGNPDLARAHAYMPDIAQALFLLGTQPNVSDRPWLLPTTWNGSVRGLIELFASTAGRRLTPVTIPAWVWPLASLFDRELRAIPEMLSSWNAPVTVDDSRFRKQFGMVPTPIERAVLETLESYGIERAGQMQLTAARAGITTSGDSRS